MILSYQTKVNNLSKEVENFFNDYASLYSNIERQFYIDNYKNNETRSSLKKLYTSKFGITARHYNAIAINTDGKLDAVRQQWSNLSYQTKKFCNFNDRIELLKVCNY